MIIKSSQRAAARQLANHLMNNSENEEIQFSDQRGLMAKDVFQALDDMELLSLTSNCEKHLYHISINPDRNLDNSHWQLAWELYETEFGLNEQPYIEVTHRKPDGRLHKHRVYSRIDVEEGKAVQLSFTKIRNEKLSRILEYELSHPLTIGKHNRAVINYLKQEGLEEIAAWMEAGKAHQQERPVAQANPEDHQQQKRTKIPLEQVKADLLHAYQHTDNGTAFEAAIAAQGYILARGDRRDLVIVDEAGGIHSPRRRLGINAKELQERWQDLNLEHLPTVKQVRQERDPTRRYRQIAKDHPPDEATQKLQQERDQIDQEIQELLRVRGSEVATPPLKRGGVQSLESRTGYAAANVGQSWNLASENQEDKRSHIKTLLDITLEPERSERSSGVDSSRRKNARFQPAQIVTQSILSLSGRHATEERERRIQAAEMRETHSPSAQDSKEDKQDVPEVGEERKSSPPLRHSPIREYLTGLGQLMKEKGRDVYRLADRFLAEKLSRQGYSQAAIRSALFRASPELMNQQQGARMSYVWRLVGRVHKHLQSQKTIIEKKKAEARKKMDEEKNRQLDDKAKAEEKEIASKTSQENEQEQSSGYEEEISVLGLGVAAVRRSFVGKLYQGYKYLRKVNREMPKRVAEWAKKQRDNKNLKSEEKSKQGQRQLDEQSKPQTPERDARQQAPPNRRQQSKPEPKPDYDIDKFADVTKEVIRANKEGKEAHPEYNIDKFVDVTKEVIRANKEGKEAHKEDLTQNLENAEKTTQEDLPYTLERIQEITKEVLADLERTFPEQPDPGDKPEAKPDSQKDKFAEVAEEGIEAHKGYTREQFHENTKESLLTNKQYLQARFTWLQNKDVAKRYETICKSHEELKDKDWSSLDSTERYQKHFMSDEFIRKFKREDYANREPDKWITKGMIYKTFEEAGVTPKTDEELGQDLRKDHLAIAESSLNAARMDDQHGYAGKLIEEVWQEEIETLQNMRKERSLADVFEAYQKAAQVQPEMPPPDLGPER